MNLRSRETDLCSGNSRKAIKRFWSHINKEKSSTIENIKEIINPETNKLTSNKEEIMNIAETHLISQLNAFFNQKYDSNNQSEEHKDHQSYCKRKHDELEDNENSKK